jgi:O-antigen/teichoic acid export membrane protein
MDHRRRLVVNIFSNWTRYALVIAVVFLVNPYVIRTVGIIQFDLWGFLVSGIAFVTLLDLGVQQATVRFVAARTRAGDSDGVRAVFNVSQRFFALVAAAVVMATAVAAPLLYWLMPESRVAKGWDPMVASLGLVLLGLNMATTMLFAPWNAMLYGKQRYELSNAAVITALAIRTALIVTLLRQSGGVLLLGLFALLETFVRSGLVVYAVRRRFSEVRIDPQAGDRTLLRSVAHFSLFAFLITLCSKIIYQSPILVLGIFARPGSITIYSQPLAIYVYLGEIIWSLAMVFVPFSSALQEGGESGQLRTLVPKGTRYCLLIAAPILFFLMFFGREFLYVWQGWRPDSEMNQQAYMVLALLALGALLQTAAQVPQAALLGMAKHRALSLIYGVEALLNLGLSVILVQTHGILGVALGGAIPPLLSNGILLPLYTRRVLGISPLAFFRESILPVAVAAIPAGIASYFFAKELIPIVGRATLLLAAAVVGSLFALSALCFGVPPEDRQAVFRWLLRRPDPA